jgi:RNA polymerase-binding protein DksA
MNAAQLKALRGQLIAEQRRLLEEIEAEAEEHATSAADAGEEQPSSFSDMGSELVEHERSLAMENALEHILTDVEHALRKMDAGTYGMCDECGREIDLERLQARPQATICLNCKVQDEHTHSSRGLRLATAH